MRVNQAQYPRVEAGLRRPRGLQTPGSSGSLRSYRRRLKEDYCRAQSSH